MTPTAGDPAGLSRRQIMASGALATIAVLAGDRGLAAASPVRHHSAAVTPPRLRLDTTPDLTTVLAQSPLPPFAPVTAQPGDVTVSPQQVYQPFLGVGAALTDSAAYVLTNYMTADQRSALLTDMYSPSGRNWQMLRVCMGSPDFRSEKTGYTYDDGTADPSLTRFSVVRDTAFVTPVIQEILAINPAVKVLATPWTPPAWMLASGTFEHGGCTFNDDKYMPSYAQYFVKFIQAYRALGIPIWAVTAQNEAVGGWFMNLSQDHESDFIGAYLGPALASAGLGQVKIFAMDDQWSESSYGQRVYTGDAHAYTAGIAYHGYRGTPAVMSSAYGEQHLTEWRSKTTESLDTTMAGMAGGYVAGGVSNWARSVILWNLALDQNGAPNQNKPDRRGVVTVKNTTGGVTRNPEYYALAHLAMFAQPGALRCQSPSYGPAYVAYTTYPSDITTTALVNPDGSVVLYVYNGAASTKKFQIIDASTDTGCAVSMTPGELSTFVW